MQADKHNVRNVQKNQKAVECREGVKKVVIVGSLLEMRVDQDWRKSLDRNRNGSSKPLFWCSAWADAYHNVDYSWLGPYGLVMR